MSEHLFKVKFSKESYDFLAELHPKIRKKILYNIDRVSRGEKNKVLFSKLEGTDIWEFRTLYDKMIYRLFAFWDVEGQTVVVTTHGLIKKTQKTPPKEILKAEQIKKRYLELKKER